MSSPRGELFLAHSRESTNLRSFPFFSRCLIDGRTCVEFSKWRSSMDTNASDICSWIHHASTKSDKQGLLLVFSEGFRASSVMSTNVSTGQENSVVEVPVTIQVGGGRFSGAN